MKRTSTFLCTGLLLGAGVLTYAQEPTGLPAPPGDGNTKVNQQDRSQNEPTEDQQKDNRSIRDITRNIRQSIVKDKSLSTYAHTVNIITQHGQVTSRDRCDQRRKVRSRLRLMKSPAKARYHE